MVQHMTDVWTPDGGTTTLDTNVVDVIADATHPICAEADCAKPVRKAGKGYSQWCLEHAREHRGERVPRSRQAVVEDVKVLADKRTAAVAKTEKTVVSWLVTAQVGFIASGDVYCAKAIEEEGPPIARALAEVAQDFPMLKKTLEAGDKWGALAVLGFHTSKLALAIGVHHNVIPYEGVIKILVPPPFTNLKVDDFKVVSANDNGSNPTAPIAS